MAIFTAISTAITAISSWTISFGALGNFAIGNFLLRGAVQLGLSALTRALAGKDRADPFSIQGSIQTGGIVPRSFPVGPALTAGSLVWHSEWGNAGGSPNAFYTQVIAVSDLPVSGLARWFIDGRAVTLEDTGDERGLAAVEFREGGADYAWIRFHDGNQTAADPFLVGTVSASAPRDYSASRIGAGVAYAVVTFRVNQGMFTGFPRSKFVLDGVPLYDVSKDDTAGGTGAHRWDDPATWGGDGDALPAVQAYNLARGLYYRRAFLSGAPAASGSVSLGSGLSSLSFRMVGGGGGGIGGASGSASVVRLFDGADLVQEWTAAGGLVASAARYTTAQSAEAGVSAMSPRGNGGAGQPEIFEGGSEGAGLLQEGIAGGAPGAFVEVSGFDLSGLSDPSLEVVIGTGGGAGASSGGIEYTAARAPGNFAPQWFYGLQGLTAARLPAAHWIAQIGKCRAPIQGEEWLEPSYRCAGEISVDSEVGTAFEAILTACAGRMSEIGGVFKIQVGAPDAPVASFADADILSTAGQSFTPFHGLSEAINGVIGSYPSPDEAYTMRALPPLYRPELEVEDGNRRLMADVKLTFVPFAAQAQRLLVGELAAARRARRHTFSLPARFRKLEPGDAVTWASARNGYVEKQFRVDGVLDLPNCDLVVDLTEVDPADHGSWDHARDFVPVPVAALPSIRPAAQSVVGFSVAAFDVRDASGGARRPGVLMSWDASADGIAGIQFEVRLAASGLVVAAVETRAFDVGSLPCASGLVAATAYEVRARYIPDEPRAVAWSAWRSVTTNDVRLEIGDISPAVAGQMAIAGGASLDAVQAALDGARASRTGFLASGAGFGFADGLSGWASVAGVDLASVLPPRADAGDVGDDADTLQARLISLELAAAILTASEYIEGQIS